MIDVTHPGSACLKNSEIKEKIAAKYKVADPQTIFLFGFKTKFGGGKTRGYCCIYDTLQDAKKFSPLHMLVRVRNLFFKFFSFKIILILKQPNSSLQL